MFEPAKSLHRKAFKGRIRGNANVGYKLEFGSYGMKCTRAFRLDNKQMEALRATISKKIKKLKGKFWFRVMPSIPVTKKPADVRMGKGKGALDHWVSRMKPGRILFEMEGISLEDAMIIVKEVSYKLPGVFEFVKNHTGGFR